MAVLFFYAGKAVVLISLDYGRFMIYSMIRTAKALATIYKKEVRTMNLEMVMQELEALGKERTKKIYQSNGAHEPLFGVATGEMKPLSGK